MTHEDITPERVVLANLLQSDIHTTRKIIKLIKKQWFTPGINRTVFEICSELCDSNIAPDLVTVFNHFKKTNRVFPKKTSVSDISKMTNNVVPSFFSFDTSVYGTLSQFQEEYNKKLMLRMVNGINIELTKDIDQSYEIAKKAQKVLDEVMTDLEFSEEKSNIDIIFGVVEDHNNAKNGTISGIDLGYSSLREKVLIEPTDLAIIGARPSMGKTAFAISLIVNLVFRQALNVVFFAIEMNEKQMVRRLLSALTGINSNKMKYGNCSDDEMKLIYNCQERTEWKNIKFICGARSHQDIRKKIIEQNEIDPVNVFFVDYLQKVKALGEMKQSRYEVVTEVANALKEINMDIKVPCIALAQVSRDSAKAKAQPTLADIRNSGDVEQDADFIGFLHRDSYYGITTNEAGESTENIGEFIIAKNRDGALDTVHMEIHSETQQWMDKHRFQVNEIPNFNHIKNTDFESDKEPF